MATAFNMLRSNDLIWPYVINNYLKGKEPLPFDLLYWNSDATRMPAANHSFYLRNCYLDNRLAKGEMDDRRRQARPRQVKVPIYNLATREDHIAPAKSVFLGSKFFGGPVRFVLAGSGHIAGVVNPPDKQKYQYWTGGEAGTGNARSLARKGDRTSGLLVAGLVRLAQAAGSTEVPAREPGGGKLKPIEDAPGAMCECAVKRRLVSVPNRHASGRISGRSTMTIEGDSSRREFLGVLGAGIAATGALAAPTGVAAQDVAPLKIVDFHNHYMGPSWTLTNMATVPPAARPAWEEINRTCRARCAAVVGRSRGYRGAGDQHADGVHRGCRRQCSGRRDPAHQRPDGRAVRQAPRQALRACHGRRFRRRRRRARADPRGQASSACAACSSRAPSAI